MAGLEQARARQPDRRHLRGGAAVIEEAGFAVVRSLVGHGVGRRMHEEPQIPNFGAPGRGAAARGRA